jgi:hypothetical protein
MSHVRAQSKRCASLNLRKLRPAAHELRHDVPGAYKLVPLMSRMRRAGSQASRILRTGPVLVIALSLSALSSCKFGKSDDSGDRPLPAPEPPAPDAGPIEPVVPSDTPRRAPAQRDTPRPATDTPPPAETAAPTAAAPAADAGSTSTPTSTPPTPTPTASALPTAAPDLQDKAIACMNKCQGSLSGCMSKPVPLDGGIPSLESMSECKKAFDECRTACTP